MDLLRLFSDGLEVHPTGRHTGPIIVTSSKSRIARTIVAYIAMVIRRLLVQPPNWPIRYEPGMRENRYEKAIACIDYYRTLRT